MTATRTMHRRLGVLIAAAISVFTLAVAAPPAQAALEITSFDGAVLDNNGDPATQAGSRPFSASTEFFVESVLTGSGFFKSPRPIESIKDTEVDIPPGFVGNPQALPACSQERFVRPQNLRPNSCPEESQIGLVTLWIGLIGPNPIPFPFPLYNLAPPPGTPGVFGFSIGGVPAYISAELRTGDDYGITVENVNAPISIEFVGLTFTFWGIPADPIHDDERGYAESFDACAISTVNCSNPSEAPLTPYLTLPTSCVGDGPNNSVETTIRSASWEFEDIFDTASFLSHDNTEPIPNPIGADGCNAVPFEPRIEARPTTNQADSASGLDVALEIPQSEECLEEAGKVTCDATSAHLRDTTVRLPEDLTLNPAAANGLGSCTEEAFGLLPSSNNVQRIELPTEIVHFTLSFQGQSTGPLEAGAEAAAVQAALEVLPGLDAGDVLVSGEPGGPYRVEFTGDKKGQAVSLLTGAGFGNAVQRLAVDATGGSFTLTYEGFTTADISAAASAGEVETAINALPSVIEAGGAVTVSGGPGDEGATTPYVISFDSGAFIGTAQALNAADSAGDPLTGGASTVELNTLNEGGPTAADVFAAEEGGALRTTPDATDCPRASRLASVQVESPAIEDPLPGSVYLAEPFDNPFDSLIALYLEVDDEKTGIVVKLAGEVELDQDTGQLSATFEENPQLPVERFELSFFGGSTGALRTPAVCGEYTTESDMIPWTAPEGKIEHPSDTWAIQSNCSDSEGSQPHAPAFDAGAVHPIAAAESPFVMHLRREDGSQNIKAVNVSPPPGLLAKLAGTQICPDAFLAAAESKDGSEEEDNPSCPATSRLGRVVAGAGAGPAPYYAPGTVYLAGPYKGAPLSLAVITPATAGPFDLGTIVVRIAAYIDPRTARITAISDPLPEMLEGIPLDIRTVDLVLDKPQFTRNPTSCDPMTVEGLVASTLGALAPVSNRFQVGECGRLGFKPKVFLRLYGKRFTRGANPRLRAIVVPRPGDANIGRTAVKMPRSLFLDQSHIRTVCTRVQFAANACPAGSVYGHATAFSPLVDYPLSGNVYLRSSDNKLPDLVADLRGPAHQPVRVEVVGRTDSVKGALRNTFDIVPDAPVSKFVLHLQAGKKSLLVASRNLCAGPQRARVNMAAQNGRQTLLTPKIRIPCKKQRRGKGKAKRRNKAAPSQATARR